MIKDSKIQRFFRKHCLQKAHLKNGKECENRYKTLFLATKFLTNSPYNVLMNNEYFPQQISYDNLAHLIRSQKTYSW